MPSLIKDRKRERRNEFIFAACFVIALTICVVPAYASAIGDILATICSWLISFFVGMIMGLLEEAAKLFLSVTSIDINAIIGNINDTSGMLGGFKAFSQGIQIIATALAAGIFVYQLFAILWGPMVGAKQTQSIGNLIVRAMIFIPLTYFMQDLMFGLFGVIQNMYNGILVGFNAYETAGLFSYGGIAVDPATMFQDMGYTMVGNTSIAGELCALVIGSVLLILVTWNFIKFMLEMTQRFVAMVVYTFLSPLAAACAVSVGGAQILKQTITLFLSSGVLWILNIWCVGIIIALFKSVVLVSVEKFFLWAVLCYGFIKIAQQLDDVFNAVGATNVRFSGSLLDDVMSMGAIARTVSDLGHKAMGAYDSLKGKTATFAENGFGPKGNSPSNPATPQVTAPIAQNSGTRTKPATGGAASGAPVPNGTTNGATAPAGTQPPTGAKSTPKSNAGSAAGTTAAAAAGAAMAGSTTTASAAAGAANATRSTPAPTTFAGKVVAGFREHGAVGAGAVALGAVGSTLKPKPGSIRDNIGRGIRQTRENFKNYAEQTRADVQTQMGAKSVNNVTQAVSSGNTMNLNQKDLASPAVHAAAEQAVAPKLRDGEHVVGLTPNADGTGLNATTIRTDFDGNVTMGKISDITDMRPQPMPQSVEGSFAQMQNDRASVQFDNGTAANITTVGDGRFSVVDSAGNSYDVSAKGMTAQEVASGLAGDVTQADRLTGAGTDVAAMRTSMAGSEVASGKASGGYTFENSADTSFSMQSGNGAPVTMSRTSSDGTTDTWTAQRATADGKMETVGTMSVAHDTPARDVANEVMSSSSSSCSDIRSSAGVQAGDSSTRISFAEGESAQNAGAAVSDDFTVRTGAHGDAKVETTVQSQLINSEAVMDAYANGDGNLQMTGYVHAMDSVPEGVEVPAGHVAYEFSSPTLGSNCDMTIVVPEGVTQTDVAAYIAGVRDGSNVCGDFKSDGKAYNLDDAAMLIGSTSECKGDAAKSYMKALKQAKKFSQDIDNSSIDNPVGADN